MQPETTLKLKCPSCGTITAKTLTAIKRQQAFDCDCGYHAELRPQAMQKPQQTAQEKQAIPA